MATIAGVTVTFGLPEDDTREQNDVIARASDGTFKYYKYRTSDRLLSIPISGLTTTQKSALIDALEADADKTVAIDPDAHVDLGGGAGTAINAKWLDPVARFVKGQHEFWSGVLNFARVV